MNLFLSDHTTHGQQNSGGSVLCKTYFSLFFCLQTLTKYEVVESLINVIIFFQILALVHKFGIIPGQKELKRLLNPNIKSYSHFAPVLMAILDLIPPVFKVAISFADRGKFRAKPKSWFLGMKYLACLILKLHKIQCVCSPRFLSVGNSISLLLSEYFSSSGTQLSRQRC